MDIFFQKDRQLMLYLKQHGIFKGFKNYLHNLELKHSVFSKFSYLTKDILFSGLK